ncbi:MAG: MFS transporter [Gammaproteobacteria bacterium RIFOXYA12_FULL_61_12]|nr:MAG: MFS transporter [Gammaproteobacteria bacterium RIFOXYD12_FULL_61_37]OGT92382.1 MAG: MFS transporter [Gammaproteobacteria bacterium RIFOXYA12_FULL_61_12]
MSGQEQGFDLNPTEKRAAAGLVAIFTFRMLGLFLILPVFALYAHHLTGSTPLMIGLAIGAFGLTQALLQIPVGTLSDRIGRKPVIITGLLLYALGSAVAALSTSIEGVIAGRLLQGSGAIAAPVMALAADLTREVVRTRVMAMIGVSIGIAFILSLILGPMLAAGIGVSGIFWISAGLALLGILLMVTLVPSPEHSRRHHDAAPAPEMMGRVFADGDLLRLDFGVFVLHMALTSVFLVAPLLLRDRFGLESVDHWQLYLPVMLLAMGLMVPFVILAEKRHLMKEMFVGGILVAGAALILMYLEAGNLWLFALVMIFFFAAFNLLEAIMPSWVSKVAAAEMRGTAMGMFATSQFAGAFAGGLIGGSVHQRFGLAAVFLFSAAMMALWALSSLGIRRPRHLSNFLLPLEGLGEMDMALLSQRLMTLPGVKAVQVIAEDGVAYMKVDNAVFDSEQATAIVAGN